jgi:hypothetical protein
VKENRSPRHFASIASRVLFVLAGVCTAALVTAAIVGRPRVADCPAGGRPCDPRELAASWLLPSLVALALAIVAFIAAGIFVTHRSYRAKNRIH